VANTFQQIFNEWLNIKQSWLATGTLEKNKLSMNSRIDLVISQFLLAYVTGTVEGDREIVVVATSHDQARQLYQQ